MVWEQLVNIWKEKLDSYITSYTKMNSREIENFNVKNENI